GAVLLEHGPDEVTHVAERGADVDPAEAIHRDGGEDALPAAADVHVLRAIRQEDARPVRERIRWVVGLIAGGGRALVQRAQESDGGGALAVALEEADATALHVDDDPIDPRAPGGAMDPEGVRGSV